MLNAIPKKKKEPTNKKYVDENEIKKSLNVFINENAEIFPNINNSVFFKDFGDMITKKGCFLDIQLLVKYDIYSEKSFKNINRILKSCTEDEDYVRQYHKKKNEQGKITEYITYLLSSDCFRKLVFRSKNKEAKIYMSYILEMEKACKMFLEYQVIENLEVIEKQINNRVKYLGGLSKIKQIDDRK